MKKQNLKFFIITGVSGAGKSQTLKCLEDLGFFCVDNLPIDLISPFINIILNTKEKIDKVGLGIDIRTTFISKNRNRFFDNLTLTLNELKNKGINYKIIFLDADNSTLVKRFSETRRKHPIGKVLLSSIKKEKIFLEQLKASSDKIIDTTNFTLSDLKSAILSLLDITPTKELVINIVAFGYKYGLPIDADIILDLRFLVNPNYVPNLKKLTGNYEKVKKYILKSKVTKIFLKYLFQLFDFVLTYYVKEGKSYLTIGCGCTGGKHRSVVIANILGDYLYKKGYTIKIQYRDIKK